MALSPSLAIKPNFIISPRQPIHPSTHAVRISCSSLPVRRRIRRTGSSLKMTQSKSPKVADPSSFLVGAAASVGLALVILSMDGSEAHAMGPDGPLMEEFWDNMRRYGLYVLTVSTGAITAIATPIFELLKNPITALLIVVIAVGSGYILSQVLSLMFGINEYAYQYAS